MLINRKYIHIRKTEKGKTWHIAQKVKKNIMINVIKSM